MKLRDWRHADPARLRACYEAEARSWNDDLGWDTAWTWATVEQARVAWGLPGLIAEDHNGAVAGWAFWMPDGSTLHLGGLVAADPAITALLLEGVVDRAKEGDAVAWFVRDRAPGLRGLLGGRGFSYEQFLYLVRQVSQSAGGYVPQVGERWNEGDFPDAVALIGAAYSCEGGRHFAPHGTTAEWTKYLSELVDHRGCGEFDSATTRVVRDGGGLAALALVTALSARTAHLAQLVVRPDCRGRGIAAMLVAEVMDAAAAAGRTALTLLVGEGNTAARALYEQAGFEQHGVFIAGRCDVTAAVPAAI